MSRASTMLNQISMFEDHQELDLSSTSQLGYYSFSFPPINNFGSCSSLPFGCSSSTTTTQPPPKTLLTDAADQMITLCESAANLKPKQDLASHFGESLQGSRPINLWGWGEMNDCMMMSSSCKRNNNSNNIIGGERYVGVASIKMKKVKSSSSRRKVREPRFCFKTLSTEVDVLDDGYKWRKYGQKVVKNTQHPRSYYRCTQDNCRVKKRVERLAEDPRMVITTYEGRHIHSPSHDEDDHNSQPNSSSQINSFFW